MGTGRKLLANEEIFLEWIRDQYGIFPEHGFDNDPMYPKLFNNGTDPEASNVGCTDLDQKVRWTHMVKIVLKANGVILF